MLIARSSDYLYIQDLITTCSQKQSMERLLSLSDCRAYSCQSANEPVTTYDNTEVTLEISSFESQRLDARCDEASEELHLRT